MTGPTRFRFKNMPARLNLPANTSLLNIICKQPDSAAVLRDMHRQVHNANPVQFWIALIAFADDPRIPLRNAGSRLQLPTHSVEPAGAFLRSAESNGLRASRVGFVRAHVHVESQVTDAERNAVRFNNPLVGVGFLGLVHESDVVLTSDICFSVAHYIID